MPTLGVSIHYSYRLHRDNVNPYSAKVKQFNFHSLEGVFRYVIHNFSKPLQILLFKHPIHSQQQWFDRLIQQIKNENSHSQRFKGYSARIDFRRQNLTSVDVRYWRLKSILAGWEWTYFSCPYTHNIGIQINRIELSKTVMMISNWTKKLRSPRFS